MADTRQVRFRQKLCWFYSLRSDPCHDRLGRDLVARDGKVLCRLLDRSRAQATLWPALGAIEGLCALAAVACAADSRSVWSSDGKLGDFLCFAKNTSTFSSSAFSAPLQQSSRRTVTFSCTHRARTSRAPAFLLFVYAPRFSSLLQNCTRRGTNCTPCAATASLGRTPGTRGRSQAPRSKESGPSHREVEGSGVAQGTGTTGTPPQPWG